jgi:DNA polymerase family B
VLVLVKFLDLPPELKVQILQGIRVEVWQCSVSEEADLITAAALKRPMCTLALVPCAFGGMFCKSGRSHKPINLCPGYSREGDVCLRGFAGMQPAWGGGVVAGPVGKLVRLSVRRMVTARFNTANGFDNDCDVIYGDTDSVMVNFKVWPQGHLQVVEYSVPTQHSLVRVHQLLVEMDTAYLN